MPLYASPMAPPEPTTRQRRLSQLFRVWRGQPPYHPPSSLRWGLRVVVLALYLAVVGLGLYLLGFAGRSVSAPVDRRIEVPYAKETQAWEPLHRWVIQQDGRLKPFETFCQESVRTITGSSRFEGNDAVAIVSSWLLLYSSDTQKAQEWAGNANCDWEKYPFILCRNHALRQALYRAYHGEDAELSDEEKFGKYVSPAVLRNSPVFRELLEGIAEKTMVDAKAPLTLMEKKAREVKKRFALYQRIRAGGQDAMDPVHAPGDFGVVALDEKGSTWFSLHSLRSFQRDAQLWDKTMIAQQMLHPTQYQGETPQEYPRQQVARILDSMDSLRQAYLASRVERFSDAVKQFVACMEQAGAGDENEANQALLTEARSLELIERELWFNQHNPFQEAWISSLAASILLVLSVLVKRWRIPGGILYIGGLLALVGCLGWSVVGFYCRVTISGRPPVSNMYESIIWVAFMVGVFALILEVIYRRRAIALAGAMVATLGFVLADQLPLTFSPSIQPLQAVLRSNYWLIIHVLTIVSSYAAFALAWGISNLNLIMLVYRPLRREVTRTLATFCYRAIQIGVVLLAAGTLLGGFWAAESWGRFWGWDPKEVWALVALLCYVIPLHARYVGWVRDFGMSLAAVVCFSSVVMAWYGVNFVLGAGLHSYGFGGGNDLWVYWAGLLNIALALHATLRHLSRGSLLPRVQSHPLRTG